MYNFKCNCRNVFDPQTGFCVRHPYTNWAILWSALCCRIQFARLETYTHIECDYANVSNVLQTMLWLLVILVTLPNQDVRLIFLFSCAIDRWRIRVHWQNTINKLKCIQDIERPNNNYYGKQIAKIIRIKWQWKRIWFEKKKKTKWCKWKKNPRWS